MLDEYNKKRDFKVTAEPKGKPKKSRRRLRFVVQHHLARRDHYDFRLEWQGALLSWAIPKGPSMDPRDKRLAVRVEDHPLDYRNFEGTIPKGEYGGGTVMLWDEGFWEPLSEPEAGLKEGALKFVLKGERLKGSWALIRLKPKKDEDGENWILLKENDEFALDNDGISAYTTSVRTLRTMEEIAEGIQKAQKNPFDNAPFQLARLTERVPEGEDRLFEVKYDGYRIMAYVEGNKARLVTRNGNDLSGKFGEISGALAAFSKGRAMVLDGEIVVADRSGKTDFQALQSFLKKKEQKSLTYIVFDLLALDGEDLREKPLIQRKETLNKLLADAPDNIQYSGHVAGKGGDCFKAACAADFEGIVGKRADSRYLGTRNSDWIKLKCRKRQEFVVGGYTVSGKGPRKISSLLLGVYDGGALVYVGRAGTGLNVQEAEELEKLFGGIKAAKSPFESALKARAEEKIVWLKPLTAAEVEYAEITADNVLRQASFKGLRTDKDVKEIVIERAESGENAKNTESAGVVVGGIKISNPDKIIFTEPQITKADVVRYYAEISKAMLPYVAGRILSIVRCPKGVAEACFYKKHPDPSSSKIVTVPVPASDGETDEYFYIADAAGLIYEAQMGTLEFHIWGSRAAELEKPDLMVFDLDPDEGMPLATVRQGVKDLKSVLDGFSLKSYLKTSGGKGYHVVVPFLPEADWEAFRAFAKKVAQIMEERWPSRYTSNMRKASRGGKIYIDWVRNGRSATSVAPYSLRARPSAPVSAPISWQELETIPPDGIKLNDALSRVKRGLDPWKSLSKNKQHLKSI